MITSQDVVDVIERRRKAAGISKRQIQVMAGLSESHYRKISQSGGISIRSIGSISKAIGTTAWAIIQEAEEGHMVAATSVPTMTYMTVLPGSPVGEPRKERVTCGHSCEECRE